MNCSRLKPAIDGPSTDTVALANAMKFSRLGTALTCMFGVCIGSSLLNSHASASPTNTNDGSPYLIEALRTTVSTVHARQPNTTTTAAPGSCIDIFRAAQDKYDSVEGNKTTLCACNSPYLKDVDNLMLCVATNNMWSRILPWSVILTHCNPRKENC